MCVCVCEPKKNQYTRSSSSSSNKKPMLSFFILLVSASVCSGEWCSQTLDPPTCDGGGGFGSTCAISPDANFMMIGAPFANYIGLDSGQVFAYQLNQSGGWEIVGLEDPTVLTASSKFGAAIALTESLAVVGAPNQDVELRSLCGMAWLYQMVGTIWTSIATFVPTDEFLRSKAQFGSSVALSGNNMNVFVGAPDLNNIYNGFVVLYNAMSWGWPIYVVASDGVAGDRFGASVSTNYNGTWFVVGAYWCSNTNGAIYVFKQSEPGIVSPFAKIQNPGRSYGFDLFGTLVRMSFTGEMFMVGMTPVTHAGKVFVYELVNDTFVYTATLSELYPETSSDKFATSIALAPDGNSAIIGAPYKDTESVANAGTAYRFERISAEVWQSSYVFGTPTTPTPNDLFGGGEIGLSYNGSTFVCGGGTKTSTCGRATGISYIWTFSPPFSGTSSSSSTSTTNVPPFSYTSFPSSSSLPTTKSTSPNGLPDKMFFVIAASAVFIGILLVGGIASCCLILCRKFPFYSTRDYSSQLEISSCEETFDDLPDTPAHTLILEDEDDSDDPIFNAQISSNYHERPTAVIYDNILFRDADQSPLSHNKW